MSTLNDLAPRVPDEIPTISELIEKGLAKYPDKSQAEIAREMGFSVNQINVVHDQEGHLPPENISCAANGARPGP